MPHPAEHEAPLVGRVPQVEKHSSRGCYVNMNGLLFKDLLPH
jgi:hypothetical protein